MYYYQPKNASDLQDFLKHLENLNQNYQWFNNLKPTEFKPTLKEKSTIIIDSNKKLMISSNHFFETYIKQDHYKTFKF